MNGDGDSIQAPWEVKKGLRAVESSDGVHMMNPASSATGLYGQRWSEIKDLPMMEGITREQFAADTALQNQILDMRWRGDVPGVPGMMSNAELYMKDYPDQINNLTFNELAMLSNLTGREGGRNYFASIRDSVPFKLPGINKTPEEYIARIREGLKQKETAKQDTLDMFEKNLDTPRRQSGNKLMPFYLDKDPTPEPFNPANLWENLFKQKSSIIDNFNKADKNKD